MAREHASPGQLVRHHRMQRGLTQTALARLVCSGQSRISHIERGDLPSRELAERLDRSLGLGGELQETVEAEHDRRAQARDGNAALPGATGPVLVGRERELAWLDTAVAAGHRILVLDGPAGSGKTALAVAWSTRHCPGEVVAVPGYTPDRALRSVGALAGDLLRRLGGRCTSTDLAAQARAVRRAARPGRFVVLDDVDGEQVAPLLPALSHCVVVLTARQRQHDLAISYHARRLAIDGLPHAAACALLSELLDAPHAVLGAVRDEIAHACDGLPLALRAVAEAIRDTGTPPPSPVTAESLLPILQATAPALLRATEHTLDRLDASVRAVLQRAAEKGLRTAAEAPREVLELLRLQLLRARAHGQLTCPELVRAYLHHHPAERRLQAGPAATVAD
ncbi:helix-turn-helix domain-containing protein [Saccharopolyspora sp. ID03-671]|uniref:helix-turn-helix domain-containing protein n=1 Tax=Saccharopolyspora sp. ID03-671 TaxID=3073066 RepID=UPI0032563FC4